MLNNAESAKSIIVGDSELIEDTEDTDQENENIEVLANTDDKENTKHVTSNRAIKEVKGNNEEKVEGQKGKKKENDIISNKDDK